MQGRNSVVIAGKGWNMIASAPDDLKEGYYEFFC